MPNIFISYSFKDSDCAHEFSTSLKGKGFSIFLAEDSIKIGSKWSNEITEAISSCNYFLVLLSENSILSEMVSEEIAFAKKIGEENAQGFPVILPIRINLPFEAGLPYHLGGYLNSTQQRLWNNSSDTQLLVDEIAEVILEGHSSNRSKGEEGGIVMVHNEQPMPDYPLELPEGSVIPSSPFYIERANEAFYRRMILNQSALIRIKGPSKFGANSFLSRAIEFAKQNDHLVITIDFNQLSISRLKNISKLLEQLCLQSGYKLNIKGFKEDFNRHWQENDWLEELIRCRNFFEEYLLKQVDQKVLLALNDVDRLFEFEETSTDFFAMLRSWHEASKNPDSAMSKLKMVIAYSTDTLYAIRNLDQSPFNVGEEFLLTPFNHKQVEELVTRHQSLHLQKEQVGTLIELLGGHPYLTRKALFLLAKKVISFEAFIDSATSDYGPFRDHLRKLLLVLTQNNLLPSLEEILKYGFLNQFPISTKLKALGLVVGEFPNLSISCDLYRVFFTRISE